MDMEKHKDVGTKLINELIACGSENTNDISDGYHTFGELYEHRIALFIALCKHYPSKAWKSKKHHDGTSWDGWFIVGIGKEPGHQITYHLPIKDWAKVRVPAYDKAPCEWDGHTPADVVKRLFEL